MSVGGTVVRLYTKTGRLVRHRTAGGGGDGLQWRPATNSTEWPRQGLERAVTDDFSANGAFLSFSESRQRLGTDLAIDTLRIHDADTVGVAMHLGGKVFDAPLYIR